MYRTIRISKCLPFFPLASFAVVLLVLASGLYAIPFDARVIGVVADPAEPNRLYASSVGGILKSEDRGKTWEQIPVYPLGHRQPGFTKVQFDSANTATIYALATGDLSSLLSGMWRSYDRGAHWEHLSPPGTFPEGSNLRRLLVAPSDGSVLYASVQVGDAMRTYRSSNGGSTWTFAVQAEVLAIAPNAPNTIYWGGIYQIYRSTNGGASWSQIGQTKETAAGFNGINGIAISPANPNLMIANVGGSSSNSVGIYRSTNGGTVWTQIKTGSAVGGVQFNPKNPTQIIVGDCCGLSLWYSSNSGQNFEYLPDDTGEFSSRLTMSPANTSFDPSPNGFLLHGISTANNNGGVAERSGPTASTKWKRVEGTYTPSAVASASVKTAKVLSDDASLLTDTLLIQSAEGSTSPRFTISAPASIPTGTTVAITHDGSNPENPTATLGLRRSSKGLGPGVYSSTIEVPVTGAKNNKVVIPGEFEVLERPASPGVYLGRTIPPTTIGTVYGLAYHQGSLYIGGFGRIDAIGPDGTFRRVAGKGTGNSGDGGPALDAEFTFARSLAVAPNGTIYFTDSSAYVVRAISPDGIIRTVAGSPNGSVSLSTTLAQTPASGVRISSGMPLATRSDSSLLIGISSRVWHLDGSVLRPITGNTTPHQAPEGGLRARDVLFSGLRDLFTDSAGRLLISTNRQVLRINNSGVLEHLAGTSSLYSEGPNAREQKFSIEAFTMQGDFLFFMDGDSGKLKRVDPDFTVHDVGYNGQQGSPSGCSGAIYVPLLSSTTSGLVVTADGMIYAGQFGVPRFWSPLPTGTGGDIPSVPSEGIVNAASFGREISPGSLASVFGSNVAGTLIAAPALPLPAQLGGGVACIDSQVAPQIFASPLQLNVQVPYGIEAGTRSARFFNARGGTAPVPVQVQASSPEVFRDQNGRGIIVNPNGSLNRPGSGASPGEYVIVYLTGTGDVEPAVPTGAASPADALSRPKQDYRITVGGADRDLYFLGLTPGFAGLAQANLEVPQLSPGEHDLTITVGGHTSQTVKLTVK